MKYRHVLDRRTFLRGAGGVAIGLPFLDEMTSGSALAATATPVKCITVFFAEGCGAEFVARGLSGPLAPWKRLVGADKKMSIFAGIKYPGAFHEAGGAAAFTGSTRRGDNASGPSIDQHALRQAYPNGAPTAQQTVSMGAFFRRKEPWRHIRTWNAQGAPADIPTDTPSALLKRLFGGGLPANAGAAAVKAAKYNTSILDTVLPDYRHFSSAAGGLGAGSRAKLRAHLDHLETLEKQSKTVTAPACAQPSVSDPHFLGDQLAEASPLVAPAELRTYWRVLADIYALGVHCDLFRFGNAMFGGAAERYRFRGPGTYDGQAIAFNDSIDLHEQFHQSPAGNPTQPMLWHLHFIMEQVVYLLDRLDDPAYAEGGRSFLERHLVMVSTELGNGASHECDKVFHAVSGAGGKFRSGVVDATSTVSGLDFYNTALQGLGIQQRMGLPSQSKGTFAPLLA